MRVLWPAVVLFSCLAAPLPAGATPVAPGPPSMEPPDFRALEETRTPNRLVEPPIDAAPAAQITPRVLLAGDSWAQYMWDDGSHNDIFDKYGFNDRRCLSLSLGSDPGPGHTGPEYSVSGSEARQWADTANYPWIANMVAALQANPTIDVVVLSIGGNDILAGKSDGGWYKQMDLDVPGSEALLFDRIRNDTFTIINAALAVRPDIKVVLSSYEYPNFNVGFWCFVYACPKRNDLSRDPNNALITDAELNQMMVTVEQQRVAWTNSDPRVLYDHSVGLMHRYFGDGVTGAGVLPHPGQNPPDYLPFPGGNPQRPTLRSNFRRPGGIDADPIHLNLTGYQYKITSHTETYLFPHFRGPVTATFVSEGGNRDGWADGTASGTDAIRAGDNGSTGVAGLISFDTSAIPDGATVTGARLYLVRQSLTGANPFTTGALGAPRVDVVSGSFGGNPAVEPGDASAAATAADAGFAAGSAKSNFYAVRLEIEGAGLAAVNTAGTTQFRVTFPAPNASADYAAFYDGDAGAPAAGGLHHLGVYMGSLKPFLDVSYDVQSAAPPLPERTLLTASPNPFGASTVIGFALAADAAVTVDVFDIAGRRVRSLPAGTYPAGPHTLAWDGRDDAGRRLPPGVYFARMSEGAGGAGTVRIVKAGD